MKSLSSFTVLTDRDLLDEVKRLARVERQATAELIASLAEVDARRLYLGEGCSSLFAYCTQVLHLSEHAAYGRIEAARAVRRFPAILESLGNGSLTLTAVTLLAPHLSDDTHVEVIESARYKSKREIEQIVAALRPRPDVATMIRKLPQHCDGGRSASSLTVTDTPPTSHPSGITVSRDASASPSTPAPRPATVVPLAPERYKMQLTIGRETHNRFRRVQDLLRHSIPNGDPAQVFDRALTLLEAHLVKQKLAAATTPRASQTPSSGRTIPAAVRRTVWTRDDGRCAFVGTEGRCRETGFLEFHHVLPYAHGGAATVENIQLRCRAHNQYEADREFGEVGLFAREATVHYGAVG